MQEKTVFYDIGANVGLYSIFLGSYLSQKGNIIAFEPVPRLFQEVYENADLNNIDLQAYPVALSDKTSRSDFHIRDGCAGHGLEDLDRGRIRETISVDVVDGNGFLNAVPAPEPTVVKIDVEGAEYDVLSSLGSTLESDSINHIYIEVHLQHLNQFGHNREELYSLLREYGFEISVIGSKSHEQNHYIRASKPE